MGVARITMSEPTTLLLKSSTIFVAIENCLAFLRVLARWEKPTTLTRPPDLCAVSATEPPSKPSPITVICLKSFKINTLRE